MKILAIDDERLSLNRLVEVLEKLVPNAQIVPLRRYEDFMAYREKSDFDAAFKSFDPKKINCDLTKLLSGDIRAINTFKGEYMIDYSWAHSGSTADLLRGAS